MNPLDLLDQAVEAIKKRPVSGTGKWYICFLEKKIQCRPTCQIPKPEIIFWTLTEMQSLTGLTGPDWDELTKKIVNFYEQKGISPCPQKLLPTMKQPDLLATSTQKPAAGDKKTKPSATD